MTKWIRVKCLETKNRKYLKANRIISSAERAESIVLLKLDAIGDFIIWLDSAKEYRNLYPKARITLVCNESNKMVAEKLDLFDEIIAVSMDRFLVEDIYKREVESRLKERCFKTLVQTEYSRTIEMDILAAMIPAAEKIAMEADESQNNLSRYIARKSTRNLAEAVYSSIVGSDKKWKMELLRNADFIRELGNEAFRANVFHLPVMAEKIKLPETKYFIIFPGASSAKRQWYPEKFAHVMQYIFENTDYCGMLCGAKADQKIAGEVIKKTAGVWKSRIYNKTGKTTLPELIEYIRNAVFIITNDTSGVHFAAAVQTPSVCIMGEHNKGRFLPYRTEEPVDSECLPLICSAEMACAGCTKRRRTVKCLLNIMRDKHFLCIKNVKEESVKKAVDSILSQYK